ncbi:MAG: alkane 1-monooxygenase [Rhodobacteraceae bacterium]|nr:alkane 1-monooxygenase [Paracoccaceae bacterium]
MSATTPSEATRPAPAVAYLLSFVMVPLLMIGAVQGGWTLLLAPLYGWGLVSLLDALLGLDRRNPDPQFPDEELFWHRAVTLVWPPVQAALIFGGIAWIAATDHLSWWEMILLFFGIGVASGTVGINFAHELMHQRGRLERWLADLLLAMVLYGHFRSEHLRVHHLHVGTPRDPVTARYNEGFHRFFPRVLAECPVSAFRAERAMLERRGLPWWHRSNPFWTYAALQAGMLLLAAAIGGWLGLALFLYQAFIAVWQLELVNYIEHYGLTRKHLGEGRYEHVRPRHSWNAAHRASNWLLINLQRHSDHHYKPDRPYPLLQTHDAAEAPQLPFGYPVMTMVAMIPPLWRRAMNPRVRAWRRRYYPEITDWTAYSRASGPMPRGS